MKLLAMIDADTGSFKTLRFPCGHTYAYPSTERFKPDTLYCTTSLCRHSNPRLGQSEIPSWQRWYHRRRS